jgi:asparagine synthase (glutamine-hydrolysing)
MDSIFEPGVLDGADLSADDRVMHEIYFGTNSTSILHRMLHLDLQVVLADNDLRKVTRICELAGIRVRYPMLDDDVVDVSARIPGDVLIPGAQLRHFYKQTFRDFLPEGIINKKKHGFGLPGLVWLMKDGPLRDYVQACLVSFRARHILRADFVTDVADYREQAEPEEFASMAIDLSFLELWLQTHVDAAADGARRASKFVS